ncbi:hypothetical protein XENOCAPTIV_008208 [Xenoophorus captivus]|uniref:Uncharacterized protein n=1 Tax=Xenoophorus captivus TaxID=1517983 RepID=A0ABV0R7P9_9TELE
MKVDQSSCAFLAHTSPKHQRSTSMFHSKNGVLFIKALLDFFPNVSFMDVGIDPNNFGPNFRTCLTALWHSDNFLMGKKPCRVFFSKCLLIVHFKRATLRSYVVWYVTCNLFLCSVYCIPSNFPGSCG